MEHTQDIKQDRLAHAWAELQAHSNTTAPLRPDSNRLAFADPMYICMDSEYNQYEVEAENMGDSLNYLQDGMELEVVLYDGKAISVELPTTVVREITWTEPAVKGDTSGKVLKPAKIATGFEIGVPIFVAQGDVVEIDTRTGEYRKRV